MKKLALTIFFDSFVLMLLGLVIILSASSTYSSIRFDNIFYLFNSHVSKVIIGIILMILFSFIPYELYKDYSKAGILLMALVLFLTLFFAPQIKGAGRWIRIGAFSFQPADVAKLVLIIHLSKLIEDKGELIKDYKNGFIYLFFWIIIIAGLIFLQPNVSNAMLVIIIGLLMMFVGGANIKHLLITSFSTLGIGLMFAMFIEHSRERIVTFIHALKYGGDMNLQVKQALVGLGSGGLIGVGIGNSKQSNLFLPEAYGDFIFAILGEEVGFIGSVLVLMCFLVFFIAGIIVAKKAKDTFGKMLAFGITVSITIYAFVNVAVATGLFPTTGLPLPFISYGGTSLMLLCISVGILINIALSTIVDNKFSALDDTVETVNINNNLSGTIEN